MSETAPVLLPRHAIIGASTWCLSAADLANIAPTSHVGGRPVWSEDSLGEAAIARWGGPEGLAAEITRRAQVAAKAAATRQAHETARKTALAARLAPLLVNFDEHAAGPAKTFVQHGKMDDLALTAQRMCELAHLQFATDGHYVQSMEEHLIELGAKRVAEAAALAERETLTSYPFPEDGRWQWLVDLADSKEHQQAGKAGLAAAATLCREAAALKAAKESLAAAAAAFLKAKSIAPGEASTTSAGGSGGSVGSVSAASAGSKAKAAVAGKKRGRPAKTAAADTATEAATASASSGASGRRTRARKA